MIVLDLSQDQVASVPNTNMDTNAGNNSSVLSDIIQATGIVPNDHNELVEDNNTEKGNCVAHVQDEYISDYPGIEKEAPHSHDDGSKQPGSTEYPVNLSSRQHELEDESEHNSNKVGISREKIRKSQPTLLERNKGE